jgi:hypothetical protein
LKGPNLKRLGWVLSPKTRQSFARWCPNWWLWLSYTKY